jgi:hypothetical protein
LLGVKNEQQLHKAYQSLVASGIQVAAFEEPDRNNELTAIASAPLPEDSEQRHLFRRFQLLTMKGVEA